MVGSYGLAVSAALVVAGGYCLARVAVAHWRPSDHGVDVDLGHVLMCAAMVTLLLRPVDARAMWLLAGLFAAGSLWFIVRAWSARHPALARIAVMNLAMVAMLVPMGAAEAAPARHEMDLMGARTHAGMDPPTWLTVVLVLVSAGIGIWALRAAAGSTTPRPSRLGACCEAVMAGAMAAMALLAMT